MGSSWRPRPSHAVAPPSCSVVIGVIVGLIVAGVVLVLALAGLIALTAKPPSPARLLGYGLGGVIALFLIGRAVAEFFNIHYSDPASYRHSWGGPSLVGVFLVHSGPGAAIFIAVLGYLFRWWPPSRKPSNTAQIDGG
jgi:hypothetical protein